MFHWTAYSKGVAATALPIGLLLFGSLKAMSAQSSTDAAKQPFGKTAKGEEVYLYTLKNSAGMEVKITNYGGTIASIKVPDKNKKFTDVVLGFDSLSGYTQPLNTSYFGALIGRYGNRLAHGTFTLDGHQYHVPTNDGPNSLHGGTVGFNKRVWTVEEASNNSLKLSYLSPDGEEGYPGNLKVNVHYSVGPDNSLKIDYSATTDKPTVLNLTNHSYFNLAGAGSETVLHHKIMLAADRYTPVDETLIPTGKLEPVSGTPFDFRKSTEIGSRIDSGNEQLKLGKGYDHNFVLNHPGDIATVRARVEEPTSGRVMEVLTTQPGIQFYTGNFLDGKVKGIGGVFRHRSALCLETQHFPDSPNHPNFPSTVLRPGQQFQSTTIYRFSTE